MENMRLGGESIVPRYASEAKKLIGKRVEYLRQSDIDKSGRGYYFPRVGRVESATGRNIEIDGDWVSLSELVEMREVAKC